MLFNDAGELLLVRNSYGDTRAWVLPGGGIRPWEEPALAAAREIKEEVGVEAKDLRPVATYQSAAEGKRDSVHLFTARSKDRLTADNFEIAEARYFALDGLPEGLSPATVRRIAEQRGQRPVSAIW